MRVLVTGGRTFSNVDMVAAALSQTVTDPENSVLIHGDARGADTLCAEWAKEHGMEILPFPAKWNDLSHPDASIKEGSFGKYDSKAGLRRNVQMLTEGKPDICLAFPGGEGTHHMVAQCLKAGIPVVYANLVLGNSSNGASSIPQRQIQSPKGSTPNSA